MARTKAKKHTDLNELEANINKLIRAHSMIIETQEIPEDHDFPPGFKNIKDKAKAFLKTVRTEIDEVE